MEHARHRAERKAHHLRLALALAGGAVAGALAVGAVWVFTTGWESSRDSRAGNQPVAVATVTVTSDKGGPETREQAVPPAQLVDGTPTPAATTPVHLLGDSLAVGIAPYVDAGLGVRPLTTDAAEGRGTGSAVSLLTPYAATSAPIWVVSLGTNDNTEDFPGVAEQVMQLAGPRRCVVWFDVWRLGYDEQINAELSSLAARHRNLHVIGWHDVAAVHPEWFSGSDVHPSSAGYAVRGQMAIDAVTDLCDVSR